MPDNDMNEFMSDDDRIQIEERLTIPYLSDTSKETEENNLIFSNIQEQANFIKDNLNGIEDNLEKQERLKLCSFSCSEQDTKICRKCQRQYCIMHASRFSPNLCQDCFKNVQVVLDKFSRTFEYIGQNGQAHYKKESCNDWHMDGPDWPFMTLWINKMTDEELESIWMFHYFVVKTIEVENDLRKVNKRSQIANTYKPIGKAEQTTGQMKVTTTKTTKTTMVVTAESIRQKLVKSGITDENMIQMMIKAAGF